MSLKETLKNKIALNKKLLLLEHKISEVIDLFTKTIKNNGKILICGNGGSAADAQHLAAELLIRLKPKSNRPAYPAISLAMDTSTLTACGNDLGFKKIFSRNLQALGNDNDILLVISTSGKSKNILEVLKTAKKKNIYSVSFLGSGGGQAKNLCDCNLIIPSNNTARIQECHIFLGHYIFEQVEKKLKK